jgi:hypothetical protein
MCDARMERRIGRKYRSLVVEIDERRRRQWAAAEAREAGRGGISMVARATGLLRPAILAGLRELGLPAKDRVGYEARVRCPGGGRRALVETDSGLLTAL